MYGNVGAVSIDRRFLTVSTQRARQVCIDTEMLCKACWKAMVGFKGLVADVCSLRNWRASLWMTPDVSTYKL